MSNHLAVAMVTAALTRTLVEALADPSPGGVENTSVTTLRPQSLAATDAQARGINVFLYHVTPNGAWTVADLPTRGSDGQSLVARPRQALDLHYLLTFSGDESTLEPQRLLGLTVSTLASRPVLSPELIRRFAADAVTANGWQQYSDLADQPDSVRFSLQPMDLEESTKLWSSLFHSNYRLSIAYQATAVLIEGREMPTPPTRVATRSIAVRPSADRRPRKA
ncbi:DUF4255 domain-containing protein [Streptomyces sp. NPDC001027]|uniref:DUF4255 domain-containing protein n=1 Tax=Streptomyces sp. NPDC001027 TaxID=3154771 RepID=UPI003328AA0A